MRSGRLYFKDNSVRMWDAHPRLLDGLAAAAHVFESFDLPAIVTSLNDGQHRNGSYHYLGEAADLRSHHVRPEERERLRLSLQTALGPGWRVLLESRGEPNEHYHMEVQVP